MPRLKKKCDLDGCDTLTHGKLCAAHNYESRKHFPTRREYARNHSLKAKYGMTFDDFWVYWIAFRGKCGICSKDMAHTTSGRGQNLDTVCVDHDHKTGKVRGLLCSACNKGLGLFSDSIENLEKAKRYLENA